MLLYPAYATPVAVVRDKARALPEADPLWDGRTFAVQMTDTQIIAIVLRVLLSATTAGSLFDLRCHMREALIQFLQTAHPESLPRPRLSALEQPSAHQ